MTNPLPSFGKRGRSLFPVLASLAADGRLPKNVDSEFALLDRELATEIVHIGQTVMEFGGKIDYFCNTVFNYPTMAECYKVAAFDGINRLCLDIEQRPNVSPSTTVEPVPIITNNAVDVESPVESV